MFLQSTLNNIYVYNMVNSNFKQFNLIKYLIVMSKLILAQDIQEHNYNLDNL
ncbi:hypothetical protein LCGC14_0457180 [marine sediment metagenome]|uniref:Uncharacterized protein n=1 Tax=marine sediment metagenome TaxID=412755 RepID=A0A0F9VQ13_9ZZZZ